MAASIDDALLSLEGLSVGDAFGELFFSNAPSALLARKLPPGPWPWTDDTHMALSVVEVLKNDGRINQDALADAFAERFAQDPYRGYGPGTMSLLARVSRGEDWRALGSLSFPGGSYGNGAAMRAAPIGGFFGRDPARAAAQAQLSAVITHTHPEGQAGAMAVAAAAAIAARPAYPTGGEFLRRVLDFVPDGDTHSGIEMSLGLPGDDITKAAQELGTGARISAQDTVPFCLWCAAYEMDDFEGALWRTARGFGDCDTTCAIVGGIVALSARKAPLEWVQRREALPDGFSRS